MSSQLVYRLGCTLLLAFACVGVHAADLPQSVTVRYDDPQHFTETRRSSMINRSEAEAWREPLKAYFAQRAARILAPGQRLEIDVTDVDLAGEYEPWRSGSLRDVRIVKNIYPPRIDLSFKLYGADGSVLREGERKLRDPAFFQRTPLNNQDSLRYEKAMIDRWLRQGADQL